MHARLLIVTQAVDEDDPVLGFFVRWIEEFAKHLERVEVICLREGKHALPANVRVHSLGKGKGLSRFAYVVCFYRYCTTLRREYDAVFVHMNPEYVLLGGLLWRMLGKRVSLWYTHKNVDMKLRLATRLAHILFSASKESFRLETPKLRVVGHGIDTDRYTPPHHAVPGVVRLMTSGRIAKVKGVEVMIKAYQTLKERHVPVELALYGSPATHEDQLYTQTLYAELRAEGEDPELLFRGSIPHVEMPKRRAEADYFLHASQTGSLDKAVLDAIMSGVIPISSSEAYGELFQSFESLLQYSPHDARALADRVVALEALPDAEKAILRSTLRTRVVAHHSLQHLIPTILQEIGV